MDYEYCMARTLEEAAALLRDKHGRVIAGGTDLVLDLRKGSKSCQALVDISEIPDCKGIGLEGNWLRIGACCTFAELESDPAVLLHARALACASSCVGSPQIRNVATVGGNVVNAMPAADAAVALVALGAEAEIVGAGGRRRVPVEDCYEGIGKSAVNAAEELICAFYIPVSREGNKNAYRRFALRESLALPVAAAAVSLTLRDNCVEESRVVLAPAGKSPWRAAAAEEFLRGKPMSAELAEKAAGLAAEAAPFRDSPVRCSAAYKRMLAQTLLRDAMLEMNG